MPLRFNIISTTAPSSPDAAEANDIQRKSASAKNLLGDINADNPPKGTGAKSSHNSTQVAVPTGTAVSIAGYLTVVGTLITALSTGISTVWQRVTEQQSTQISAQATRDTNEIAIVQTALSFKDPQDRRKYLQLMLKFGLLTVKNADAANLSDADIPAGPLPIPASSATPRPTSTPTAKPSPTPEHGGSENANAQNKKDKAPGG